MKRSNLMIMCALLYFALMSVSCSSAKKMETSAHDYDLSTKDILLPDDQTQDTAQNSLGNTVPLEDAKSVSLKQKYASYLKTTPNNIHNMRLYRFIDEWLHTPYLWGGSTKRGIDCSAFVQRLYADVYDIDVPRTSIEQFFTGRVEAFKNKEFLHEGDLVFFKTIQGTIVSHVGFYLSNHRFVNASSKGVSIGNLEDPYWKTKFVAAGRIKVSAMKSVSAK